MKSSFRTLTILASASVLFSSAQLFAQDGSPAEQPAAPQTETAPAPIPEGAITQGDAAIIIVQRLGLSDGLGTVPSANAAASALLSQGIAPFDGWNLGAALTVGDFARIMVLALGLQGEIPAGSENDPQAYVDVAKAANIALENTEDAAAGLASANPTIPGVNALLSSSDPLRIREVFGQPDERATGTDASNVGPTVQEIIPLPARPVTPVVVQQATRRSQSKTSPVVSPVTADAVTPIILN